MIDTFPHKSYGLETDAPPQRRKRVESACYWSNNSLGVVLLTLGSRSRYYPKFVTVNCGWLIKLGNKKWGSHSHAQPYTLVPMCCFRFETRAAQRRVDRKSRPNLKLFDHWYKLGEGLSEICFRKNITLWRNLWCAFDCALQGYGP